jgi:hypothetical protein
MISWYVPSILVCTLSVLNPSKSFMRSGRPLLLGAGIPQHVVDPLQEAAARELAENRVAGYIRVENAYARKKADQ